MEGIESLDPEIVVVESLDSPIVNYVTLRSNDNVEYTLESNQVTESIYINSQTDLFENVTIPIEEPSLVLSDIVTYMKSSSKEEFVKSLSIERVCKLCKSSNYLGMEKLLDLCVLSVAQYLKDPAKIIEVFQTLDPSLIQTINSEKERKKFKKEYLWMKEQNV